MIQVQGYYVMACVMCFRMPEETAERLCKLTHSTNLKMKFQGKELNVTDN